MSTQYSSRLFLIIVVGNIFFNIAVFRKPGDFHLSILDSAWDNLQTVLRFAILFCPIYIWCVKKNGCGEHLTLDICNDKEEKTTILSNLLPYVQAAYPVMLAFVLVVKIFTDMPGADSLASETTYLPLFGLTLLPFATFFLIRDTNIPAMIAAWSMCVATLAVTSWLIQSYDYVYSTICYSLIAGFIFIDTAKQNRRIFMLMKKLQVTLKVNEKLAVEAQALELRAMIGNVAHDLKTVKAQPSSPPLTRSHLCFGCIFIPYPFVIAFDVTAEQHRVLERRHVFVGGAFRAAPTRSPSGDHAEDRRLLPRGERLSGHHARHQQLHDHDD